MLLKIGASYVNTDAIRWIYDGSYKNKIKVTLYFGDQLSGGYEGIINTDGASVTFIDSYAVAFLDWLNSQAIDLMQPEEDKPEFPHGEFDDGKHWRGES